MNDLMSVESEPEITVGNFVEQMSEVQEVSESEQMEPEVPEPEVLEPESVEPEIPETYFAIADVDNYVNVRNQPSTDGEIVGKIFDGAVAEVVETAGEQGDWFRITSGNVEGYIKAEFFLYGDAATDVMEQYVNQMAQVQVERLNVREGQSTDTKRIGYIEEGEKLKVLEDCGEWLKVKYTEEKEGYVSAQYVLVLEEYSYAKTPEEEKQEIAERKKREERYNSENQEKIQAITNIVFPATAYTSNEELRKEIVNYALQYVGGKYVNGGSSLATGTDCSGFTCFIYADFGYSINRTPQGQFTNAGRSIDYSEIQPGDIICYSSNGRKSCTHVALYIGDGQIVHAANSRKGVIVGAADYDTIIGIRNVID